MTHPSLDLTAFRFENDSPAAAHHPVPLHEVTWPMIGVFAVVIGLAGVGCYFVIRWMVL